MTASTSALKGKRFRDLVQEAKAQIKEIDQPTLKQWQAEQKPMLILDVREPEDFTQGHIPGAINIPRGLLELEIDEVISDQSLCIVAYCGGGSRSALSAKTLQEMGYDHVVSLIGGYRQWQS